LITLLNSPRLTEFGSYQYRQIELEDVRRLIDRGFESAIGHLDTAKVLSELLGITIPRRRVDYRQLPGEAAIVFELSSRLPEGAILGQAELSGANYRFGLLTRIS
jgi:hypothetical protein